MNFCTAETNAKNSKSSSTLSEYLQLLQHFSDIQEKVLFSMDQVYLTSTNLHLLEIVSEYTQIHLTKEEKLTVYK